MQNPDYLSLDGKQLQILITVFEAGSLSAAARRLEMNQSTVSYWLDLMRQRLGDPLFIRVGQRMQATERTTHLLPIARDVLHKLQSFTEAPDYDPAQDQGTLDIACTAIERDLILVSLLPFVAQAAPGLQINVRFPGSHSQVAEILQAGRADLVLMPDALAQAAGIQGRALTHITDAVFFDPAYPLPPNDLDSYCARPHGRVSMGPDARFALDKRLSEMGRKRRVVLQVSDFDSLGVLIRGTPIIATLPAQLHKHSFRHLRCIEVPWKQKPLRLMAYWHIRHQASGRHRYWRERIFELTNASP